MKGLFLQDWEKSLRYRKRWSTSIKSICFNKRWLYSDLFFSCLGFSIFNHYARFGKNPCWHLVPQGAIMRVVNSLQTENHFSLLPKVTGQRPTHLDCECTLLMLNSIKICKTVFKENYTAQRKLSDIYHKQDHQL